MVGYTLNDTLPFAMMGLMLMLGYSAAFMVLFDTGLNAGDDAAAGAADDDAAGDDDSFHTLSRALETLFHTGLGNFETDVSSTEAQLLCRHLAMVLGADASPC